MPACVSTSFPLRFLKRSKNEDFSIRLSFSSDSIDFSNFQASNFDFLKIQPTNYYLIFAYHLNFNLAIENNPPTLIRVDNNSKTLEDPVLSIDILVFHVKNCFRSIESCTVFPANWNKFVKRISAYKSHFHEGDKQQIGSVLCSKPLNPARG